MKKWDIKRELVNKLLDAICDKKRSQILLQFWIVTAKQFWTLKRAAKCHKKRCFELEQEALKNMRARQIQQSWTRFLEKCAPTEEGRIENHIRQVFALRAQGRFKPQTERAKEMLLVFMKDLAKSKIFQHKVHRFNARIQNIQQKFKAYTVNSQKRYEILMEYYRSEKSKIQMKMVKSKKQKLTLL